MRSFLIRDILSGPSSGSAAAGQSQEASARSDSHQLHPTSSSFDCMTAQSLAATQARFLAKLAEHQQQVQASKYYEQLQQQHHQQLLNLNLNHHNLQLHQQQQQLLHQLGGGNHSSTPNFSTGSSNNNNVSGASGSSGGSCRNATSRNLIANCGATSSSTSRSKTKQKTSSFAYDCTSPISSISDVDRVDDDDDEGRDGGRRNDDDDDDDDDDEDDDEDVEIEVEKLPGEESEHASSRHLSRRQRSHRGANEDNDNRAGEEDYNQDDEDDDDLDDDDDEDAGDHEGVNGSNRLNSRQQQQQFKQQQQLIGKQMPAPFQLNSPLDALFQMTSTTFDALKRGEKRKVREADQHGSTNFTSKQTSKKKRKSRTAFTNNQIYELERRFREQKYLSPTDRDEIAMSLNLSNAQVITWFQNRRAKLKRDLEEQKRDIETASLLNFQKTFFESFQALSQMKTAIKTEGICRTGGTNMHEERDMNQLS